MNSILLTATLGITSLANPAPQRVIADGAALVVQGAPIQRPKGATPEAESGTEDSAPSADPGEDEGGAVTQPTTGEEATQPPDGAEPGPATDAPAAEPRDWDEGGEEVDLGGTRTDDPAGTTAVAIEPVAEVEPDAGRPPMRPEYGPFYEAEPASDVRRPGERQRQGPPLSLANGGFCFVENSNCKSALIIDADVGAGLNVVTSEHGLDVPYTQFRVRWGATLRPISIARKRWHPWGVGVVGSWSIGSASIIPGDENDEAQELAPIEAYRVALINQIWLTQKRNGAHIDISLGAVNSPVLEFTGRFWGTHAEAAIGFGGWGQVFFGADFLDRDVRAITGIRGHGIFTGPLVGLVLLGMVAGGVAL